MIHRGHPVSEEIIPPVRISIPYILVAPIPVLNDYIRQGMVRLTFPEFLIILFGITGIVISGRYLKRLIDQAGRFIPVIHKVVAGGGSGYRKIITVGYL